MASVRRKFLQPEHEMTGRGLRVLFPSGTQIRLAALDSLLKSCQGHDVLADVNSWPATSGGCSGLSARWPPMLCSSQDYSFKQERIAVAGEHMLAQGVLWYEHVAGNYGVTPTKMVMAPLSPTNIKSFAGNAIHCAPFMAWVLYV